MAKEIMGINNTILKELKNIFKETDIEEIEMEEQESFYLKISRKKEAVQMVQSVSAPVAHVHAPAPATAGVAPVESAPASDYDNPDKYHKVQSPVIGTYYSASSPDAADFVKLNDTVSGDSTLCIVEAMKVMNEIKADVKGKVVQILKVNEEPVQKEEVLFIIERL